MFELALDDVQRDAPAQEFERVRVATGAARSGGSTGVRGDGAERRVRPRDATRVLVCDR